MTFQEFLASIGLTTTSFWGIVVFLMSIGIEIIPRFKWNPWSSLIKFIGSRFNEKIDKKIEGLNTSISSINTKVEQVDKDLKKHIKETEQAVLQDQRRDILDFCNACMNKRRHTKEQFDFVIKECDSYEKYINKNEIKNGVIEAAIKEIRRIYDKCIQENSFLKEGEDDD